jgi:hypothetical protein
MWYNIVSYFVFMDFNMYSMYYLGIKGHDDAPSNSLKDSYVSLKMKTIKEKVGVHSLAHNT